MHPPEVQHLRGPLRWLGKLDYAYTALTLVGLVVALVLGWRDAGTGWHRYLDIILLVVITALSFLRYRWPRTVWLASVLALITFNGGDSRWIATAVLCQIALVEVVIAATVRSTVLTATGTFVLVGATFTGLQSPPTLFESASFLAWTVACVALGLAVRSRRAYIHAVEDRALRAEQTREAEAGRRVIEERLRIARELHDVVGHQMAVINVQAQLAQRALRTQPDVAETALVHTRGAAGQVLTELGALLHVLRFPDHTDDSAPAPGLSLLKDLMRSLEGAGLHIRLTTVGTARALPELVDLTAFRLVQEALTNAQRHGRGRADVQLTYTETQLHIHVTNDLKADDVETDTANSQADGTDAARRARGTRPMSRTPRSRGLSNRNQDGYGLIGMKERVDAVGGQLELKRDAETFQVSAVLPAPRSTLTDTAVEPAAGQR